MVKRFFMIGLLLVLALGFVSAYYKYDDVDYEIYDNDWEYDYREKYYGSGGYWRDWDNGYKVKKNYYGKEVYYDGDYRKIG